MKVLLHCWVESNRQDACKHAEDAFRKMKLRFHEGDESMRPDCISYSILLNAYAQKMMIDDAERILWEMVDDFTLNGNKAAEPRTRKLLRFYHFQFHLYSI
jgi:pentatricopeptide repeat protein